jgi:hypothetical protein
MTSKTYKVPYPAPVKAVERLVRERPEMADVILRHEYGARRPRYSLIQWLKRHRLHNPTVRVIHKP